MFWSAMTRPGGLSSGCHRLSPQFALRNTTRCGLRAAGSTHRPPRLSRGLWEWGQSLNQWITPNSETREGESMSLRVAASIAEGTVSV